MKHLAAGRVNKISVYLLLALLLTGFLVSTFSYSNAAIIFSDGFESGDTSVWSGNVGSPSVVDTQHFQGIYSLQTVASAKYVYKTVTASSNVSVRLYADMISHSETPTILQLRAETSSTILAQIDIVKATDAIRLWYRTGSSLTADTSATPLSLGSWKYLEVFVFVDGAVGEYHVYYDDGSELADVAQTGIDNNDYGNINRVNLGMVYTAGTVESYFDSAVIADSYVGPEAAGEESFSLALDTPANDSTATDYSCDFAYTPTLIGTDSFQNATLYLNGTSVASNSTAIENATSNTISYVLPGQNATYLWDVQVWNSTHALFSSNGNFTLTVAVSAGAGDTSELEVEWLALGLVACVVVGAVVAVMMRKNE